MYCAYMCADSDVHPSATMFLLSHVPEIMTYRADDPEALEALHFEWGASVCASGSCGLGLYHPGFPCFCWPCSALHLPAALHCRRSCLLSSKHTMQRVVSGSRFSCVPLSLTRWRGRTRWHGRTRWRGRTRIDNCSATCWRARRRRLQVRLPFFRLMACRAHCPARPSVSLRRPLPCCRLFRSVGHRCRKSWLQIGVSGRPSTRCFVKVVGV